MLWPDSERKITPSCLVLTRERDGLALAAIKHGRHLPAAARAPRGILAAIMRGMRFNDDLLHGFFSPAETLSSETLK